MAGTYTLAEAVVPLYFQDAKYYRQLAAAKKALADFAKTAPAAGKALGFAGAARSIGHVTKAVGGLEAVLRKAADQAVRLNRAMGGVARRGGAGIMGAMARARGETIRAAGRATGMALRGALGGAGVGLGSALRGGGAGIGSAVRGIGSGLASAARGFSSILSAGLRGATGLAGALARILSAGLSPLKGLAGGLRLGGLLGGVGGAVGVAAASKVAMDFESAMARLARTTGLRGGDLDALGGQLKGIAGRSSGASLSEVMGAAEMASKLGVSGPALARFTANVVDVKTAIDSVDLEQFTTELARLMNIFGRSHSEVRKFASAVVALDQRSTATAEDLTDITTRMAPMARFLRLMPEQALGLATAVREAGVSREVGGTALAAILGRMASQKNRQGFARLAGMRPADYGRTIDRDPMAALMGTAKGISRMKPQEAVAALEKLGFEGQRVRQTFLALAASEAKVAEFTKIASDEFRNQSAITEAVRLRAATTAGAFRRMRNQLELAAVELGAGLLPALKGLAGGLADVANDTSAFLRSNGPALADWGKRTGEMFTYLGQLGMNFGATWDLMRLQTQQGMEQIGVVLERSVPPIAAFLGDAGIQLGKQLAVGLINGFMAATKDNPIARFAAMVMDSANRDMHRVQVAGIRGINAMRRNAGLGPGAMIPEPAAPVSILETMEQQKAAQLKMPAFRPNVGLLAPLQGAMDNLPRRHAAAIKAARERLDQGIQARQQGVAAQLGQEAVAEAAAGRRAAHGRAQAGFLARVAAGVGGGPMGFTATGGARGFGAGAPSRMFGAAGAEFNRRMARGMTRDEFFGRRMQGGWKRPEPARPAADPAEDIAKNTNKTVDVLGEMKTELVAIKDAVAKGALGPHLAVWA